MNTQESKTGNDVKIAENTDPRYCSMKSGTNLGKFTDPLAIMPYGVDSQGFIEYYILHGFRFWYSEDKTGWFFDVETGVTTNLASIPKWLWSIVGDPAGPYAQPAAGHDHLCDTKTVYRFNEKGELESKVISQAEVDKWFLQMCKSMQPPFAIPDWKCNILYSGVRIGSTYRAIKAQITG